MSNIEELYEGLPKEQLAAWRREAIDKWGEEAVARSEKALRETGKLDIERLKTDQKDIIHKLYTLRNEAPESEQVQEQVARHYANIRSFWGVSDPTDLKLAIYKGLADLYVTDERYTVIDDKPNPAFAAFMKKAMMYFADNILDK